MAGGFSESQVFITWELFDTLNQNVIFEFSTYGYAKCDGVGGQAIFNAFKHALRELMANDEFVKLTTDKSSEKSDEFQYKHSQLINIEAEHQSFKLPEELEKVLDAVVLIKAGQTHGTGFAISKDGYLLTAAHVVSGLDKVHIVNKLGQTCEAEVLKLDKINDVALIKTQDCIFNPLELELENRTSIGAEIFAIGTPLNENLSWSTTKGVLSGYRNIDGKRCIQTDTSLNPGSSGGPLLNKEGKVVGVVSWKISGTEVEGISFGIDIEAVPYVLGLSFN